MDQLDIQVLRALRDWRADGRRALLATVVRTWGSSPRPVGSIMALRDDGAVIGSVSGGCIEDDLIDRYAGASVRGRAGMPDQAPIPCRYGVTADEAHRFGLPCGGTLELVLEFNPDPQGLSELVARLDSGALVARTLNLADGTAHLSATAEPQALRLDDQALVNTFGPSYRLLLIGAGQLSEYLATMALFNGFAVTVCDPREEYRGSWSVAAATLWTGMPDDMVARFAPDRRSAVIALTHDPKLDDLALMAALDSPAFYVGAIGSRRNNEARRERMREHFDMTPQALARLRGPIGLYIGSKTPAEIAVSVMAELIAVRNGVVLPPALDVGLAKDRIESGAAGVSPST